MKLEDIIENISEKIPAFNDYAIRGIVRETMDRLADDIAIIFRAAFDLTTADLELLSYEILDPEAMVRFELETSGNKDTPRTINLTTSHWRLVKYLIRFETTVMESYLYIPYLHHDLLWLKDKKSIIKKVIVEKIFSRISGKNGDGISFSPVRANLRFFRGDHFAIETYTTHERFYGFIITADMYSGPGAGKGGRRGKKTSVTIIHYLLAKFGFVKALRRLGVSKNDVYLTQKIEDDETKYYYFAARPTSLFPNDNMAIFLKVRKTLMKEFQSQKMIINLIYVLHNCDIGSIENALDPEPLFWRVILGRLLIHANDDPKANSMVKSHLHTVDRFIDPITHERFVQYNLDVKDMYELLVYIFVNIDEFIVKNVVQNLYNSRIDVSNGLLVEPYAHVIFRNTYQFMNKPAVTAQMVKRFLIPTPAAFRNSISSRKDDSKNYTENASLICNNFILSGGLGKVRLGGKAEQTIHPSMVVVESMNAFSGKIIGRGGFINPFVPTGPRGAILCPDYAEDIAMLEKFAPV